MMGSGSVGHAWLSSPRRASAGGSLRPAFASGAYRQAAGQGKDQGVIASCFACHSHWRLAQAQTLILVAEKCEVNLDTRGRIP